MSSTPPRPPVVSWTRHPEMALDAASQRVQEGGVLVYPTATVYGIGGDARREEVAIRVADLKGRDRHKPMLLLTDEWDRVRHWLGDLTDLHRALMSHPKQELLTILFEASREAPVNLRGGSPLIGVRRTGHAFCRALIQRTGAPLISTSANRSGEPTALRIAHIPADVLQGVDLVVDAGPSPSLEASTVVAVENGRFHIVREGALKAEAISVGDPDAG